MTGRHELPPSDWSATVLPQAANNHGPICLGRSIPCHCVPARQALGPRREIVQKVTDTVEGMQPLEGTHPRRRSAAGGVPSVCLFVVMTSLDWCHFADV